MTNTKVEARTGYQGLLEEWPGSLWWSWQRQGEKEAEQHLEGQEGFTQEAASLATFA